MKKSRKSRKTSDGNKHTTGKGTRKNSMSTSKMVTSEDRFDVKIPKNSKIYQYLDVDNIDIKIPIYRRLELILDIAEQSRYDRAEEEFNRFMDTINKLYPEKAAQIEKLRALILWHILDEQELTDHYYEKLKEL